MQMKGPNRLHSSDQRTSSRAFRSDLPPDRKLALVDIENLLGGTHFRAHSVEEAKNAFEFCTDWQHGDHAVVAASASTTMLEAFAGWPGARMVYREGRNGADQALINVTSECVSLRYDQVLICSGDGIFTSVARRLRKQGVRVTVVVGLGHPSRNLIRVADRVVDLFASDNFGRVA